MTPKKRVADRLIEPQKRARAWTFCAPIKRRADIGVGYHRVPGRGFGLSVRRGSYLAGRGYVNSCQEIAAHRHVRNVRNPGSLPPYKKSCGYSVRSSIGSVHSSGSSA